MTRINYCTLCVYMNGKVSVVINRNCFFRKWKTSQGYARLKAVTYIVNVVVSKIWCRMDTLLLHTSNRKYYMAYRFVPSPMTLGDLEGHSPVAGLIKCNSTNIRATFRTRFQLQLTRRVARSLGDSWASCRLYIHFHSHKLRLQNQEILKNTKKRHTTCQRTHRVKCILTMHSGSAR